ncbi:thiolase family protein [Aeromicrobium wangtongii]|uniref:thiolase family protein n=1 Tax=Aeromicrobium wangtongii TaxID=2969247 RepID=UPI0020171C62|nr:thiolase family protein [Aeromicrobium wangtongii]MCL3818613.1 thiolase family protein [Aeromicrobium wangtongii]
MSAILGRPVHVVDILRTPFGRGREGGALSAAHPVDLLAHTFQALQERTGLDPSTIDDVVVGCVQQVAEQSGNIARHATLAAGWPESVPGMTLDRKCGSFQQALTDASHAVAAGTHDVVVVGGVEMMSRIPMRMNRLDRDELGTRFRARYPEGLVGQGISAELIASRWELDRGDLDRFALQSHHRAAHARDTGLLDAQIVPYDLGDHVAAVDEGIRDESTFERLSALRAPFRTDIMAERFPAIQWVVTAGNSSQITDGAAAALVVAEDVFDRTRLRSRARIVGHSIVGDDPIMMLTGVIPATRRLLARAGLDAAEIDVFEVNEAFASVVLAWQAELGVEDARVNPWGGAIAFGHPVGASGGRLLANLLGHLDETSGRYGLWTMCESGGMANATLLERTS